MSPSVSTSRVRVNNVVKTGEAHLEVSLPEDAKVYVNDKPTSTPGDVRRYISRNLKPGTTYTYEVRAEVEREGELYQQTQVVELEAGLEKSIAFDFSASEIPVTTLTLNVPEDANVLLGGAATKARGTVREYSTSQLKSGQVWQDYTIVVQVERDGKTITQEKAIDLQGGVSQELDFDFDVVDPARLASIQK